MKSRYFLILLISIFFLGLSADAVAQRSKKNSRSRSKPADKYFDESGGSLKSRLWYGGSINFNLGNNVFLIGAQPVIGYKVTPKFSVGPYLGYDFQTYRVREADYRFNTNILQAGLMSRFKVTDMFFAHGEFVYATINGKEDNQGIITKESFDMATPRLGIGYSSSMGLFGFEILGLYEFDPVDGLEDVPENF